MIIIPMAGKSSRFFEVGYDVPKYELPFPNGNSLFIEMMKGFSNYFDSEFFLFITNGEFSGKLFVENELSRLKIRNFEIVELQRTTRGQSETVFEGIRLMSDIYKNLKDYLIIFNCDSVRKNFIIDKRFLRGEIDAYLELFKGKGDHWSFAIINYLGLVLKTAEKNRISDWCSNGLYVFRDIQIFQKEYLKYKKSNNSELYIAPIFNSLIRDKKKVGSVIIESNQMVFVGTPEEYEEL
jgi:hypothetical protein